MTPYNFFLPQFIKSKASSTKILCTFPSVGLVLCTSDRQAAGHNTDWFSSLSSIATPPQTGLLLLRSRRRDSRDHFKLNRNVFAIWRKRGDSTDIHVHPQQQQGAGRRQIVISSRTARVSAQQKEFGSEEVVGISSTQPTKKNIHTTYIHTLWFGLHRCPPSPPHTLR